MKPMFSDLEVEQISAVVHEEFQQSQDSRWSVNDVRRRPGSMETVEVEIEHQEDHKRLTIELQYQEYAEENQANGSDLTDTVFNVSIRLMEFSVIRGFDEFPNGAIFPLEIYPDR
jgi:hypothetical protein